MNKSYKSVYNKKLESWIAVAETAKVGSRQSSAGNSVISATPVRFSFRAIACAVAAGLGLIVAMPAKAQLYVVDFNNDSQCIVVSDGVQGANSAGGAVCNSNDRSTQNSRVLVYSSQGNAVTESVSIGNQLFVNGSAAINNLTVRGTRIADVAAGISGTDAVNLNQLNAVASNNILQYSSTAAPTTPLNTDNSTKSNDVTFVGATAAPVALHNVAAGSTAPASTDAINGSQLNTGLTSVANNFGGKSVYDPTTGIVTAPTYNVNGGSYTNVGSAFDALDTAVSGGKGIKYFRANSTLADVIASGANSTAMGPGAKAIGPNSIALGLNAQANDDRTISIGTGNIVNGARSGAIGDPNIINSTDSYVIGNRSTLDSTSSNVFVLGNDVTVAPNLGGSVVLGNASTISAPTAVANAVIGGVTYAFAGTAPASAVSVGSVGGERQIQNVAAGRLSGTSTDAINGSQLDATNVSLNSLTKNIVAGAVGLVQQVGGSPSGGVIKVGAQTNGTIVDFQNSNGINRTLTNIAPGLVSSTSTDAVNGAQLNAVSTVASNSVQYDGATKAVVTLQGAGGTTLTNVKAGNLAAGSTDAVNGSQLFATDTNVTNIINGKAGLVQQASPTSQVTVAGSTAGTSVNFAGTAGPRTLAGVAAGSLTATSTDAVNGSQLFTTNSLITNITNGGGVKYFHTNSVLADSSAVGNDSVAIGPNAIASYAGSVALGLNSITSVAAPTGTGFVTGAAAPASEVSIGGTNLQRRLTNLSAGALDTDAVNVAQLKGVTSNINTVIGQTVFDPTTGKAVAPSFTVQGNTYNNVTNAFGAVDATLTTHKTDITNLTNGSTGIVRQDAVTHAITIGAQTGGTSISVANVTGGTRTITGVTAGSLTGTSTDAINGAQLNKGLTSVATNLGGNSKFDPVTGTVTAPTYTVNNATYNNVGAAFDAIDQSVSGGKGIKYFHATSVLADSVASGVDSVAVGPLALASNVNAVAMGANAQATGVNSTALGANATVAADNSVALGQASVAARGALANYTAFGLSPVQNSVGEVSIGATGALRQLTNVAAGTEVNDAVNVGQLKGAVNGLGSSITNVLGGTYNTITGAYTGPTYHTYGGSTTTTIQGAFDTYNSTLTTVVNGGAGPVQYSNHLTPTTPNGGTKTNDVTLVGANTAAPVGLHNVAAGSTTKTSTDAVNGAQLNGLGTSVAAGLGGGSTFNEITGAVTNPTYNLQGSTYNNVGSALGALDKATTSNTTAITNISNGTAGIVRQEGTSPGTGTITVGAETQGTKVDFKNSEGVSRTLSGVAAGALGAGSTDVVNGAQLFTTNEVVRNITTGGAGVKYFHANSTEADSQAVGVDSVAVGPTAVSNGTGSVAVGSGSSTGADRATAIGQGAQAQAEGSVAIGAGSVANRGAETYRPAYFNNGASFTSAGTVSVGSEGAERVIANVAPGVKDTDAANVGQVKGLASGVDQRLRSMERSSNRAIASTAALSFQPVQQHPGQFVMSAGIGHYAGESALGVGGNYLFQSGRQKVYAGVAGTSGGKPVIQVGFSAAFGD